MRHSFEFTVRRDPGFQFPHNALTDLLNPAALGANQMMLMSIAPRFQ